MGTASNAKPETSTSAAAVKSSFRQSSAGTGRPRLLPQDMFVL